MNGLEFKQARVKEDITRRELADFANVPVEDIMRLELNWTGDAPESLVQALARLADKKREPYV